MGVHGADKGLRKVKGMLCCLQVEEPVWPAGDGIGTRMGRVLDRFGSTLRTVPPAVVLGIVRNVTPIAPRARRAGPPATPPASPPRRTASDSGWSQHARAASAVSIASSSLPRTEAHRQGAMSSVRQSSPDASTEDAQYAAGAQRGAQFGLTPRGQVPHTRHHPMASKRDARHLKQFGLMRAPQDMRHSVSASIEAFTFAPAPLDAATGGAGAADAPEASEQLAAAIAAISAASERQCQNAQLQTAPSSPRAPQWADGDAAGVTPSRHDRAAALQLQSHMAQHEAQMHGLSGLLSASAATVADTRIAALELGNVASRSAPQDAASKPPHDLGPTGVSVRAQESGSQRPMQVRDPTGLLPAASAPCATALESANERRFLNTPDLACANLMGSFALRPALRLVHCCVPCRSWRHMRQRRHCVVATLVCAASSCPSPWASRLPTSLPTCWGQPRSQASLQRPRR